MAQMQGSSSSSGGRLDGSLQRDALTNAAFALGVGWGDGAVTKVLTSGSTDQRGTLTITSVGSNQAQATATVTFTFADGAYASAPFVMMTSSNDNSIDTGRFALTSVSTTQVVWTFSLLPVASKIYKLHYAIIA